MIDYYKYIHQPAAYYEELKEIKQELRVRTLKLSIVTIALALATIALFIFVVFYPSTKMFAFSLDREYIHYNGELTGWSTKWTNEWDECVERTNEFINQNIIARCYAMLNGFGDFILFLVFLALTALLGFITYKVALVAYYALDDLSRVSSYCKELKRRR